MIPFLDVKAAYLELKKEIDEAVARVLASGWYILGPEVEAFEAEYAAYVGASHCVGVGNGFDALVLGLKALDIGPGDEVIVPANTYIATWLAVSHCGAIPVPVDPDPVTHCLNPAMVSAAVTKYTKAVLPVHLYGHPADLHALRAICDRDGLKLIEDAAQAHGAAIADQRIGAFGDVVAWSFYPGKNLGALGDAGAITTNNSTLAERMAILRNYGSSVKYVNLEKGVNTRLDPVQAAVLRVKLPHLENWNARRSAMAQLYSEALAGSSVGLPTVEPRATHAWHLYVIRHPCRDALQKALQTAGVSTIIHYPIPPFRQQAYAEFSAQSSRWPIAARLADEVLSLPMGPHLSRSQIDGVISAVRDILPCL